MTRSARHNKGCVAHPPSGAVRMFDVDRGLVHVGTILLADGERVCAAESDVRCGVLVEKHPPDLRGVARGQFADVGGIVEMPTQEPAIADALQAAQITLMCSGCP